MKIAEEEIEAGRSEKGGWNKKTLAKWGVPWPPPLGWKQALIDGTPLNKQEFKTAALRDRHIGGHESKLLHRVVMAVIENGHADILAFVEGLEDYYDNKLPTVADVIGGRPQNSIIEGKISFDDLVYKFSCIRAVKKVENA